MTAVILAMCFSLIIVGDCQAQIPPSANMIANYQGLHKAAHSGDLDTIQKLVAQGQNLEQRDDFGRTPLHVAAYASQVEAMRALAMAGADLNAMESQAYDIVTIAAVANDLDVLDAAIALGSNAGAMTSPYDGTALIAAAHLGHHEVVGRLIAAGAPLDHVNNLAWTAMIEAVVLGDGGPDHVKIVRMLVDAGADKRIGDRNGVTPLDHARARGYREIVEVLQ